MSLNNSHIILSNLSKRFNTQKQTIAAFENISFDVMKGEFVAILGPSGCGKTSLLRIIAGLDEKTEGEIEIANNRQGECSKLAMVFQEHGLFPWMSLAKNIRFVLENTRQFSKNKISDIVDFYLRRVGLIEYADLYPHQVSGGMRQRISIARSFAIDPDILLMDEPFVFLDFQSRLLLHELLLQIWQETNKTILFVTHDIEEAVLLADRILVLSAHPGRLRSIENVELSRPRDLIEIRKNPIFYEQVARLTQELKTEIQF